MLQKQHSSTDKPLGLPCCVLEQDIFTPQKVLVISRKRWLHPNKTEKLFTGTLSIKKLDLMFMKHYAPNRCLYIKVAKLRTGVGSTGTSYLQNCSVKLFKEHFKVQICKGRLFQNNKITFFLIFTNLFPHHPLSADQV